MIMTSQQPRLQITLSGHTSDINWLSFSSGILASCSSDKSTRLWSVDDWSELPTSPLLGHSYSVRCCAFSLDGSVLVTCSHDGKILLWNPKNGEKLSALEHHSQASVRICAFSPDGEFLATGGDDETICIWNLKEKKLQRILSGTESSIVGLAYTPDGSLLASGTSIGDLRLWDGHYGYHKPLSIESDCHDLGVTCCHFSPTYGSAGEVYSRGSLQSYFLLATSGFDNFVKLWDILALPGSISARIKLRATLAGHASSVMSCCFSPTGRILASSSSDKTVRLWDPVKANCIHIIDAHSRYVTTCAFSMDGRLLASASNDQQVKIWDLFSGTEFSLETEVDNVESLKLEIAAAVKKPLEQWQVEEVCLWLREIGLPQYEGTFRKNDIDGLELGTLSDESLSSALSIESFGHRQKLLRAIKNISLHPLIMPRYNKDEEVPDEFCCPITHEMMHDPVIASDGYSYERSAIEAWLQRGRTCSPMTNRPLRVSMLTSNRNLQKIIQARHAVKQ